MAKTPTPARVALAAAVGAVRDRAGERAQIEAAFELASEDISKSWAEMGGLIEAIEHHPKGAAEELLARVGRKAPQHVLAQFEDQAREEEPQSSRDLKAKLRLAEEILEDRKRVRAELQVRIEGFDQFDFTLDRARRAARAVILKKRFDLFGVLFLSFVVSVAGGMMRDVLIGAIPPVAIADIHYFGIAMVGGLIPFIGIPM